MWDNWSSKMGYFTEEKLEIERNYYELLFEKLGINTSDKTVIEIGLAIYSLTH
jgi:hypothetical protein